MSSLVLCYKELTAGYFKNKAIVIDKAFVFNLKTRNSITRKNMLSNLIMAKVIQRHFLFLL